MNQYLTDITVVLDRSGSMSTCRTDAEGGLNQFITDQKKSEGECVFTLVQFDTDYEFVHKGVPINEVGHCQLTPRGMTALHDAVGRAINETGLRLSSMPEESRPGLVIFVILTDGMENASKEFKLDQIKEMIQTQQDQFNWKFTFLGANQDAFAAGSSMGIDAKTTANYSTNQSQKAFANASAAVCRARGASAAGMDPQLFYTDKEREDMSD
ncbi:MAG: VWA domain-containing protein [Candidatus Thiodiazotropha sp.]|jgi:hypothetical protein